MSWYNILLVPLSTITEILTYFAFNYTNRIEVINLDLRLFRCSNSTKTLTKKLNYKNTDNNYFTYTWKQTKSDQLLKLLMVLSSFKLVESIQSNWLWLDLRIVRTTLILTYVRRFISNCVRQLQELLWINLNHYVPNLLNPYYGST